MLTQVQALFSLRDATQKYRITVALQALFCLIEKFDRNFDVCMLARC